MKTLHFDDNGDGTTTCTVDDGDQVLVIPSTLDNIFALCNAARTDLLPDALVDLGHRIVEIPAAP